MVVDLDCLQQEGDIAVAAIALAVLTKGIRFVSCHTHTQTRLPRRWLKSLVPQVANLKTSLVSPVSDADLWPLW